MLYGRAVRTTALAYTQTYEAGPLWGVWETTRWNPADLFEATLLSPVVSLYFSADPLTRVTRPWGANELTSELGMGQWEAGVECRWSWLPYAKEPGWIPLTVGVTSGMVSRNGPLPAGYGSWPTREWFIALDCGPGGYLVRPSSRRISK